MTEHRPNRYVILAMWGFFWSVTGGALAFWVGGLIWPGGLRGLIAALGPGAVAILLSLHIPAAIVGILLWQWRRSGLGPRTRVALEAATVYFCLCVLLGIFMNVLLVQLLGDRF